MPRTKIKKPRFKIILFTYKTLSDGTHPVMLRVNFNGERRYYSLAMSCTDADRIWNKEKSRFVRNKDLNQDLDATEFDVEEAIRNIRAERLDFTFDRFEKKFLKQTSNDTVFDLFREMISDAETVGTARIYTNVINALEGFRKGKDLRFSDVTVQFLKKFQKNLESNKRVTKSKGKPPKPFKPNSVSVYMRCFRTVYNLAITRNLVANEDYPFGKNSHKKYEIPSEEPGKRALTAEQLQAILASDIDRTSRCYESRLYYLLSVLCRGMNFIDIAYLTWDDIKYVDRAESNCIVYVRQKTKRKNGKKIEIPIQGFIQVILDYFKRSGKGYIFPVLKLGLTPVQIKDTVNSKLKAINKDLKEICKNAGVKNYNNVTFYSGRHSAATLLKKDKFSVGLIKDFLSHKDESITESYLDSFDHKALKEADKRIQEILQVNTLMKIDDAS